MVPKRTVEQAIAELRRPIFTTREVATLRSGSLSGTSQALARMERQGLLIRATKGIWCQPGDPDFSRFGLVPFLAGNNRAYVSLLSAMNLHGLIDQVPQVVYSVTTGPSKRIDTPLGRFSFHRIQPDLFGGFEWNSHKHSFLLAKAEKALVDALYLSSRRGRHFRHLPELDTSVTLDREQLMVWVERIEDSSIKTLVRQRVADLGLG